VEGTFARVFKSGLNPLEITQRIVREIDANQSVSVDGSLAVPNHFWVFLATPDHERMIEVQAELRVQLIEAARNHIRDERYRLLGPISVAFVEAPQYPEGTMQVQAQWRESNEARGQARLVLVTGERVALGSQPFTIGRSSTSSLVLDDANVSRTHAVIRPALGGWLINDLNSTNGTTVNGHRITETHLRAGDEIVFGATEATFETG
jgi:hypothetical protein